MKRDLVKEEIEMDEGVTLSEDDLFVTDELIRKIERREKLKEILLNENLSDKEKFDKLKKTGFGLNSFSELRRLKHQVK